MPESAWKFLFYLGAWSYSAYLLFGTDYPFFHDPPSVFYGRGLARWSRVGEGSALHMERGTWGSQTLITRLMLDIFPKTRSQGSPKTRVINGLWRQENALSRHWSY